MCQDKGQDFCSIVQPWSLCHQENPLYGTYCCIKSFHSYFNSTFCLGWTGRSCGKPKRADSDLYNHCSNKQSVISLPTICQINVIFVHIAKGCRDPQWPLEPGEENEKLNMELQREGSLCLGRAVVQWVSHVWITTARQRWTVCRLMNVADTAGVYKSKTTYESVYNPEVYDELCVEEQDHRASVFKTLQHFY